MVESFISIPLAKPVVNLSALELMNGVLQFLATKGIAVGHLEYAKGDAHTEITLSELKTSDPWFVGRSIFFDVEGVPTFSSLKSKIGAGPFRMTIKATRNHDEAKADLPCRIILDLGASGNADRSITFTEYVIK